MADSEKLAALKKAYAEIILNTAKEAAARVMASERKAERYRRELSAAKDEALRMLLRLKTMLDSKASEAEMTAMIQSKKVEELEAQLGEAEDIVKDLRSELRELQDELEILTNHQRRPPAEKISEAEIANQLGEDVRLSASGYAMSSQAIVLHEPVVSLETKKNAMANNMPNRESCCNQNSMLGENLFLRNSDFASIRRKEPELYRNGCTHRVRASEMSVYGGSLAFSKQEVSSKNQIDSGDRVANASKNLSGATKVHDARESVEEAKEVVPDVSNTNAHNLTGSGKTSRKKRKSDALSDKVCPDMGVAHSYQTVEGLKVNEERSLEVSESFPAKESLSSKPGILSSGIRSLHVKNSSLEFLRACTSQGKAINGQLKDNLELTGQDLESAPKLELADGRMDLQMFSVLNSNAKESDAIESPSKPSNDRILKYTFHRKRKREFPSSPDSDSSLENGSSKGHLNGHQCDPRHSWKPDMITKFKKDEGRAEQVVHQLKPLPENQSQ